MTTGSLLPGVPAGPASGRQGAGDHQGQPDQAVVDRGEVEGEAVLDLVLQHEAAAGRHGGEAQVARVVGLPGHVSAASSTFFRETNGPLTLTLSLAGEREYVFRGMTGRGFVCIRSGAIAVLLAPTSRSTSSW